MVRGLAEAGHVASHAIDGAYGLLEAQKGDFDVYVVDRMMPRMDGIGMVETLRREGDQTPVLFLSAWARSRTGSTGLKAGGDDYLVKPYAFAELIARVEALSRRRETGAVADAAEGRRPGDGPDRPHGAPRGPGDRPAAARVPAAGVPDAPRRPVGDADHAAGEGLGVSLRPPDQRHRRAHQPPARPRSTRASTAPCCRRSAARATGWMPRAQHAPALRSFAARRSG